MKILCAISGLQYSCDHIPAALQAREIAHPIFHLKQSKLFALYAKYIKQELTEDDGYLTYLAFLNSTDLVTWMVPATKTTSTRQIVANNLPRLVTIVNRMAAVPESNQSVFARIAITPETKDLSSSHIWIDNWFDNLRDYDDGYRTATVSTRIRNREEALERLIKDPNKPIERYATLLAKWAADAGNFPTFQVSNPFTGKQSTLSEYWQQMIIRCAKGERIFDLDKADLAELSDHITENIKPGTIYQHSLSILLRDGAKRVSNYLGFDDVDISSNTSFRIINENTSVQDANIMAMIDSAPESLPVETNYPSKIAYLRAKAKWDMKVAYQKVTGESK